MNLRMKFVFSIGLLGLLGLMLPGSLRADTVYTYTGNAYTACDGIPYSNPAILLPTPGTCGPYALSVTFDVMAGTPLDNLTGTNIDAAVTTFTFTDGSGMNITQLNWSAYNFFRATDSLGDITAWEIVGQAPVTDGIVIAMDTLGGSFLPADTPNDESILVGDGRPTLDYGESFTPGTWTVTSVPEPSSLLLLGTGLLALMGIGWRRNFFNLVSSGKT